MNIPNPRLIAATAMLSSFTERASRSDVAMTGEITLRGNVLPVGGVKEKVLAARRSGIVTIVLPDGNRKNLEQIPRGLRKDLKFVFVRHVLDVFSIALADGAPRAKARRAPEAPVGEPVDVEVPAPV